jgi:hypothetical protein
MFVAVSDVVEGHVGRVGYAYVTNGMGTRLAGDARDVALRDALYSCISPPSGALREGLAAQS